MAKTNNLTDFLTDLADGIRTAEGTTAKINPQNFRTRVEGIVATVTASGDAVAGNILAGKKAWVDGKEITGSIPTISSVSLSAVGTLSYNPVVGALYCSGTSSQVGYLDGSTSVSTYTAITNLGDARAKDVAKGKTFTSSAGLKITGTGAAEDSAYNNGFDEGYNEGYNEGYSEGQTDGLEALGELCQWQVMIDSEGYYDLMISNLHPSYYLHCIVSYEDDSTTLVIPPNSIRGWTTVTFADNEIYFTVDDMRWKANA